MHKKKRKAGKARDRCVTEDNDDELDNDDDAVGVTIFPEDY